MKLKQALTIAAGHVATEGAMACVSLEPGWVRATNGDTGVACPVEGLAVTIAVDCAALRKIVDAIGVEPELSEAGGKLRIKGGGARYTLGSPNTAPQMPQAPKKWTELTGMQMAALCAIADAVDRKQPNPALCAVRLTPEWVAAAAHDAAIAAWMKGLVDQPVSALPEVFQGLGGPGGIHVQRRKLWVKDSTGQIRWSQTVVHDWPDKSVQAMISNARSGAARVAKGIDLSELVTLCRRADAVAETRVAPALLTLGAKVELTAGGETKRGERSFKGSIGCDGAAGSHATVGVSPHRLMRLGRTVGAVEGDKYISVGTKFDPILLWGGAEVIMEALVMPLRI